VIGGVLFLGVVDMVVASYTLFSEGIVLDRRDLYPLRGKHMSLTVVHPRDVAPSP